VAEKKRNPEVKLLLGAVNQYPYAYYLATLLGYCRHNLANGAARGKDIIYDEDSLTGVDAEASPEGPVFGVCLFGEYAAYPKLSGRLESQDNTTSSGPSHYLNPFFVVVSRYHMAKLLGIARELQDPELLPVDGRMPSRSEEEMSLKDSPRFFEYLLRTIHQSRLLG
jgi:hypothetical protein